MYRLNEKTVKLVNEILLYVLVIEFQLYGTVWAMLNVSGKPYLILYWGFVCLGLFKLCIQGNHWKDWLLILGFGILAVLSWRASGDKTPLLFMLGVCCSRDLKLDRLMTADLAGRIVSALFLILFPLLGICPYQTISMRGIERMFFGWQGPNGMGLSFLMICMEWMYLRHRRFRWFDYAGIMGILVFVHVTANSRTAEVLMAAVLLAEAFAKLWERYGKRWKEYVIWTWILYCRSLHSLFIGGKSRSLWHCPGLLLPGSSFRECFWKLTGCPGSGVLTIPASMIIWI